MVVAEHLAAPVQGVLARSRAACTSPSARKVGGEVVGGGQGVGEPYELTRFMMRGDMTGLVYDVPVE
jgi:hypothetical protein